MSGPTSGILRSLNRNWGKNWKRWMPSSLSVIPNGQFSTSRQQQASKDYAYEMACSNIRYGLGVTQEIGIDCKNMKANNVCVMTDARLAKMEPVKVVLESLQRNEVHYKLYDKVRVEPTDESFKAAIQFANEGNFDVFVAVGGGSVMDTCKAANLYSSNPNAVFLDYVNAPIGKGRPVTHQLKPLIAVATTAGTGSETTGTAVFDYVKLKSKTGISNRAIRPTLGILDPLHLRTVPERVTAYTGIDVLCHAVESFTALPYYERNPRPENPASRPAYQGNNPISDVWSKHALKVTSKYIKSHGMSYTVSGLVKNYKAAGYSDDHPMIPHGLSVIITAPAVFKFTAPACPERHLEAAECLGMDVRNAKKEDAGKILSDVLLKIMDELKVPNGLNALGYNTDDIPALVAGTLPQHRLIKLSPRPAQEEDFSQMLEDSMTIY